MYNIFSIQADWADATSPITGGVQLAIRGQGFESSSGGSSNALVKFACPKGAVEVSGDVKGDSEIICTSPDFAKYGPDERVEVTVKIGPNRFTNNAIPFSFFSVTDASQTVAFGPGILDGVGSGKETSFVIQAKDALSKDRVCGMDKVTIIIRELVEDKPSNQSAGLHHNTQLRENNAISIIAITKLKARAMRIRKRPSEVHLPYELKDCNDGTYIVRYKPPSDGYYRIDINFGGTFEGKSGPIRGSPFTIHAVSTDDDSANDLNGSVLHQEIDTFIQDLKQSSSTIAKGLGKSVANDDLRSLITVKEHLRSLAQSKSNMENHIAANRSALLYLKKRCVAFPSLGKLTKDLETAAGSWDATKAIVPETIERIAEVDKVWRAKVRFKVEAYEKELEAKHDLFHKADFWYYCRKNDDGTMAKLGEKAAKVAMMEAETELESEKRNLDENAVR
jgi:dynein heavy chain